MTLLTEENRIPISHLTKGRDYETLRVSVPAGITINLGEIVKIATPAAGGNIAVIAELDDVANASGVMGGYYDTTGGEACEGIMIHIAPYGLEKNALMTPVGALADITIPNVPFTDTTNIQGELDG